MVMIPQREGKKHRGESASNFIEYRSKKKKKKGKRGSFHLRASNSFPVERRGNLLQHDEHRNSPVSRSPFWREIVNRTDEISVVRFRLTPLSPSLPPVIPIYYFITRPFSDNAGPSFVRFHYQTRWHASLDWIAQKYRKCHLSDIAIRTLASILVEFPRRMYEWKRWREKEIRWKFFAEREKTPKLIDNLHVSSFRIVVFARIVHNPRVYDVRLARYSLTTRLSSYFWLTENGLTVFHLRYSRGWSIHPWLVVDAETGEGVNPRTPDHPYLGRCI